MCANILTPSPRVSSCVLKTHPWLTSRCSLLEGHAREATLLPNTTAVLTTTALRDCLWPPDSPSRVNMARRAPVGNYMDLEDVLLDGQSSVSPSYAHPLRPQ